MPPHLCNNCLKVFEGSASKFEAEVQNDDIYYIHRTYQSFAQSRQTKCRLCSDLWESLASGIAHPVERLATTGLVVAFKVTYFPGQDLKPNWIFLMCDFYVRETATPPAVLRNKYVQEELRDPQRFLLGNAWYQVIYNRTYVLGQCVAGEDKRNIEAMGNSSSSQPSRELVNGWVRSCVENHPECKPWRDINSDVASPARILDVGEQASAKVHLRSLVEEELFDEDYITLSYCKGNSKPTKLTKDTVKSLESGIEPMKLPKTFRNAVAVTRQLGVRYLWISSLCIFQDTVEDRRIEGEKSGDIYANALLNICASGAGDCDGGLFFKREPLLVQPLQINMSWPVYQRHAVPVPRTLYDCGVMGEWRDIVDAAAVNRRPWPWQEQFVSRRTLYCCKEQLYWECRRGRGNESFPGVLVTATESGPIKAAVKVIDRIAREGSWNMKKSGKMKFHPPPDEKLIKEAYIEWTKLIEKVTACEVTLNDFLVHANSSIIRAEDIMLAFSGIAKRFEILLGDQYFAGLLLGKDFHNNLLWFTKQLWPWTITLPSNMAATRWKVPSWSWASILGKVEWERTFLQSEVVVQSNFLELLDVQEEPPVSDKKGAVPPQIRLRVRARKISLSVDLHRPLGSNLVDPGGIKAPLVWTGEDGSVVLGYGQLDDAAYLPQTTSIGKGSIPEPYIGVPVRYRLEKAGRDANGQEELKVMGLLVKSTESYHGTSHEECLSRIGRFTLEMPIVRNQGRLLKYLSEFNNDEMGRQYFLV